MEKYINFLTDFDLTNLNSFSIEYFSDFVQLEDLPQTN